MSSIGAGPELGRPTTPGRARTNIQQVADEAGVSPSTVSRVLSGHPNVSPAMRDRVEAAVAQLGYEPNLLAQSLRRGASNTIGFVVGDISNPLVSEITLGAEVSLQRAGYTMLLANAMNDAQRDASYIRLFAQRRVDGLLLSISDESFQPTVDALAQHELPCVLVDRELATDVRISAVVTDHDTGMSAAIEHLVELGHRRIALVNGNLRILPARAQAAAVRRSARRSRAGCVVRSGTFTAAHGEDATESLLRSDSPPTAIIAGSNQILIGVLRSLRRWGFSMPADISLVTCDRVDLAEFTDPPLATIERDLYQTGALAAALLLELVGGATASRVSVPTRFLPAMSCGAPSDHHPPGSPGGRPGGDGSTSTRDRR